ncbi:hypothetical protein MAR_030601 [Mya arenaria]|uniref:Uncharacterized protein n=1 Tax=Mya arenaria TaxID=6604 RepID=A0ABY7F311_MYAAR|nr:hypothetical protein MAR_030601 [Mya arenaria]
MVNSEIQRSGLLVIAIAKNSTVKEIQNARTVLPIARVKRVVQCSVRCSSVRRMKKNVEGKGSEDGGGAHVNLFIPDKNTRAGLNGTACYEKNDLRV